MKILLLGANGQLGWQLRRSLSVLGELMALTRDGAVRRGDLTQPAALAQTIRAVGPDVIVNAAAYSDVDRAESEPAAAFAVNAQGCETLATEASRLGCWLVHYSTDYVFDGSGERPWREADLPAPLNVYGRSKLAGEAAITGGCERHLILRTSWLFESHGSNFLKRIVAAAQRNAVLEVVGDQWGAPTRAALVADVSAHVLRRLEPEVAGIYHLAASGETSRHGYAQFALQCARQQGVPLQVAPEGLRRTSTVVGARAAARPANSRLDTTRLREVFGLALPPWQDGVEAVVTELSANSYSAPR